MLSKFRHRSRKDIFCKLFYKYEWYALNNQEQLIMKLIYFDYLRENSIRESNPEKPIFLQRYEQRKVKNIPPKGPKDEFIGFKDADVQESVEKKKSFDNALMKMNLFSTSQCDSKLGGNRRNLRRKAKKRVKYDEREIQEDDFMWCDNCDVHFYPYCQIHGPPVYIPSLKVNQEDLSKGEKTFAELTCPPFFRISSSKIPNAGKGVFAARVIPKGTMMGPYKGTIMRSAGKSGYSWQVLGDVKKTHHWIDAGDPSNSNWMRFVNCSTSWHRQNLTACQFKRKIYYRALEDISPGRELLVFYGLEYAAFLDIDMDTYHLPQSVTPTANNVQYYQCRKCGVKYSSEEFMENHVSQCKAPEPDDEPAPFMAVSNFSGLSKNVQIQKTGTLKEEPSASKKDIKTDISEVQGSSQDGYLCPHCKKHYKMRGELNKHILNHTRPHACSICDKSFPTLGRLTEHGKVHSSTTGQHAFACGYCGAQFAQKATMTKHERSHSTDRQDDTPKSIALPPVSKRPQRSFNLEKSFACGICEKSYSRGYLLTAHEQKHFGRTSKKRHVCATCNLSFVKKCYLEIHEEKHNIHTYPSTSKEYLKTDIPVGQGSSQTGYHCPFCGKHYLMRGDLNYHILYHTKPHTCGVCNKSFATLSVLANHGRVHSLTDGQHAFRCRHCGAQFAQKGTLTKHEITHSTNRQVDDTPKAQPKVST